MIFTNVVQIKEKIKKVVTTLVNNFETTHCDFTMKKYCYGNPSSDICIFWLEETVKRYDDIALSLYSNIFSDNYDKEYCSYMCMLSRRSRDYRLKFCGTSLEKWC